MLLLYFNKSCVKKYLVTDVNKAFRERNDMWFYSQENADIVYDIDRVELLPPKKIMHPVFDETSVDFLSKYAKLLILLNEKPNAVYKLSDVHVDFADRLLQLSNKHNIHLLYDCIFPFDDKQIACLPEYDVKLQGQMSLRTAYDIYTSNPAKLKSLLCFDIPKGERIYV